MILSVSSMSVGMKRSAIDIIIASSCTGTLIFLRGPSKLSRPSVRRMGEVVYVSRNVPMMSSVMRSIIVMAARTPSIVMRKIQKWHSSVPGV